MNLHDMIYNVLVRKNVNVQSEYERYVMEHIEEHYTNRLKHWKILWRLNWHYRFKKKDEPMIYWDYECESNEVFYNKETITDKKILPTKKVQKKNQLNDVEKKDFKNCPESSLFKRPEVQHFANRFMNHDIISFDIFDTLIFRPFNEPNDLFMLLEEKLDIYDFVRVRIEAEKEVRKVNSALYGNRECRLEDIYELIEKRTGLKAEKGINAEIDLEISMCEANPYMQHLFSILSAKGKRIILISDMYLTKDIIERMLTKCGYDCSRIEKIYISTEWKMSKANGKLFELVRSHYTNNEKIIHVGDNLKVDIRNARDYGFEAQHYPPCIAYSEKSRVTGMSPIIGSAYKGIIANHIYNGVHTYSNAYEHGFIYGGILALGFCTWLHKQKVERGLEKLLFVSRDGKIYMNVYKYLYPEDKVEYVYWSRIAHLNSCAEFCKDVYLQRYIRDKAKLKDKVTIDDLLEMLGLPALKEQYYKFQLQGKLLLCEETVRIVEELIISNWDYVLEANNKMKSFEIGYFKNVIGDLKKIGVVDVGWSGYGEIDLKKLIKKYVSREIKMSIYMIGIKEYYPKTLQSKIATGDIQAYAFSDVLNTDLLNIHKKVNNGTNNIYVELMSQDIIPSYIGMRDGEIQFDIPEVENYSTIEEIHQGVIEFVKKYKDKFSDYECMFCISGRDAILPLIHSYKEVDYYKNKFSDFCFSRTVLSDPSKSKIETLGEIFKKNNL